AELGFVYIIGGSLTITAEGDGISAGAYLTVSGGSFDITTGGGSGEAQTVTGFGMGFDYWNNMSASQEDSVSAKGLKAEGSITISDGTFTIDACDDALHSNGDVTISGGAFAIQSGDDGVHADSALVISGGEINVSQSYEGLEGLSIDITGGTIYVTSSDDGLNAAGGNDSSGFGGFGGDMFGATEGAYLSISGGTLYVNASGDGLDSNGSMYISGGETYVSGPTDSMNGALDFNGECVVTGGILIAVSAGGMEESVSSTSTQGVITVSLTAQQAGTALSIADSSGSVLASFSPDKSYSTVIVSCPDLTVGESYTITAGTASTTVSMTSLIYGSAGMGGMGGNMGGGRGNWANTETGGTVSDSTVGTMPDANLDSGMNYDGGMTGGMGGASGGM
ncbi:MAG: carbohydrate-binding domain-containing protein, partial [Oscillospiraceae bacterium]|nr:carbohydrate-binding domain-containing protein [Oscillospiraceae bacterium]